MFMVSCAVDNLSKSSYEQFTSASTYQPLKDMTNYTNLIFSVAVGNDEGGGWNKRLNEDVGEQDGGWYTQASINSPLNNKYTVSAYNCNQQNVFGDNLESLRPIGFGEQNRNLVVPFIQPTNTFNQEVSSTKSSWPTAFFSGTLGNHLSILMRNHSTTTLEDANIIMREKYLREETFKYKDSDDGKIKDGEKWYFFKTDEFIHNEILHETEVKSALQNAPQSLPSSGGLYYEGKGIQFTIDGTTFEMTEENRAALENAIKNGQEITWTYNPDRAKKYGVSGQNSIKVGVMDKSARLIPDLSLTIQIN